MRSGIAVLSGLCAIGLLAVLVLAATRQEPQAFSLGVPPGAPVVALQPGQTACQTPVAIPDRDAAFDRVAVVLGTYNRRGPAVRVTVAPARGGAPIGRGTLAAGYPDVAQAPEHSIPVGHIATMQPLRVCLQNAGDRRVAIFGGVDLAARGSTATLDGKPTGFDLAMVFERAHARSALSLAGAMADRASLWRWAWVRGWIYLLAALAVFVAVPALVALAMRRAAA
jgi:hypothetical protein